MFLKVLINIFSSTYNFLTLFTVVPTRQPICRRIYWNALIVKVCAHEPFFYRGKHADNGPVDDGQLKIQCNFAKVIRAVCDDAIHLVSPTKRNRRGGSAICTQRSNTNSSVNARTPLLSLIFLSGRPPQCANGENEKDAARAVDWMDGPYAPIDCIK